jgi:hypothetical protein
MRDSMNDKISVWTILGWAITAFLVVAFPVLVKCLLDPV